MEMRKCITEFCLTFPQVYEDYPFDDFNWTVMRHKENKKTFAYIYERMGNVWINVKCDSMRGDFWKSVYSSVVPAYHMNKTHWISIIMDSSVPMDIVRTMIKDSYDLISPKEKLKKMRG